MTYKEAVPGTNDGRGPVGRIRERYGCNGSACYIVRFSNRVCFWRAELLPAGSTPTGNSVLTMQYYGAYKLTFFSSSPPVTGSPFRRAGGGRR